MFHQVRVLFKAADQSGNRSLYNELTLLHIEQVNRRIEDAQLLREDGIMTPYTDLCGPFCTYTNADLIALLKHFWRNPVRTGLTSKSLRRSSLRCVVASHAAVGVPVSHVRVSPREGLPRVQVRVLLLRAHFSARGIRCSRSLGSVVTAKSNIFPLPQLLDYRLVILNYAIKVNHKHGEGSAAAYHFEQFVANIVDEFNANQSGESKVESKCSLAMFHR